MISAKKLATISLLSGMTALYAAPAGALTLMDMLRGGPGKSREAGQGRDVPVYQEIPPNRMNQGLPGVREGTVAAGTAARDSDPEPAPRISGPRYYTYKSESVRAVSSKGFTTALPFFDSARISAPATIAAAVEAYYGTGSEPVWVTEGAINDRAKAVMAFFETVGTSGLDPADYTVSIPSPDVTASIGDAPAAPEAQGNEAWQKALAQFELKLSVKVLTYVQDTQRGRVDPNKLSGYHDFKLKDINLAPVLKMARLSPDIGKYLASREPSDANFQALKTELARLHAEETGNHVAINLQTAVKPGGSSTEMASIIGAIERRGSDSLKSAHSVTFAGYSGGSEYTPELVALVEAFQKERGLRPDGIIGQATVRAMTGDSVEAKISKVTVAMEQARWLPSDLGQRFVFINQPAFKAYYHEEGQEKFDMRVVIGSKANQTYFFQDNIRTVEFNPYWGVPQSIIVNEMLPKSRNDPSYLDRLGYQVEVGGRAVSSTSVNWYGSTSGVSVRQPPGSDNALGELKILFPNAHAIYMHDTPSKSFFQRDNRALSHGCIRLAEPRKMAAAVLGTTVDDVGKQIAAGKNRAVSVPEKIPVYIAYFTAWPDRNGKVAYFGDVYDRDEYVLKAFAITSKARGA